MKHLMLAITLVALIAYSTIGCKSSGTPTAPGPSDRAAHSGRTGYSPPLGR